MLGPDDMLSRTYQLVNGEREASLFVAYYRTQLRAKNAHDPKVCLPGSGWNVRESSVIDVPLAEAPRSSEVNFYVISKLDSEAVVLYWYQTHKRVVAREQKLRFYKVVDTFADRRSDMALVRIVVPVAKGQRAEATKLGKEMIRALYPELLRYFPASQT